jgi:hypothetical protein
MPSFAPALYIVDEPEVQRLLARLEKKDQFLYKQAHENLDKWWRVEIAKRLLRDDNTSAIQVGRIEPQIQSLTRI